MKRNLGNRVGVCAVPAEGTWCGEVTGGHTQRVGTTGAAVAAAAVDSVGGRIIGG